MINIHKVKQEICDIGDRLYKKGFAAANDGNISYRVSDNQLVCTPTGISKGYMKPDDLCIADMSGKQISGKRKMTSEVKLHIAIMKERPEVKSVVHCHPPHATAFGIAREPVPSCVLPEVEIFLGDVPIAKYDIPGSQTFADTILPFVHKSNVIILANHGTVSFGETVREGVLVDGNFGRLLPHVDARPGTRLGQLFFRAGSEGAFGIEAEMGLRRSAIGSEELRHLRERYVPRELEVGGRGADRRSRRRGLAAMARAPRHRLPRRRAHCRRLTKRR